MKTKLGIQIAKSLHRADLITLKAVNKGEPTQLDVAADIVNNEIAPLIDTIKWIAEQQNLFFAECSQAEEIVVRCRQALEAAGA